MEINVAWQAQCVHVSNPFNAESLGQLHPHRWIPGEGVEKNQNIL